MRACAHGRQVYWRSMYTDQYTDRGGSKAENSVALRAVLWYCQVLPQRRERLRCRDSARRSERCHPQPASPPECSNSARREKQQPCSFGDQSRKVAAAGKQAGRGYSSSAGSGNCADHARHGPLDREAFSPGQLRNREAQQAPNSLVSRHRCSTLRCSTDSNQKTSKRKASWYGKETYATQMARTGALAQ